MKSKQLLYLLLGMALLWLLASTILRANLQIPIRLFSDDYDRFIYFQRGMWLVNNQVPYRDVISEYPQVPTFLFGLFHIPALGESNPDVAYWKFSSIFSLSMFISLVATIELLCKMLPGNNHRAYLLLLPAPLYFAFNRFDILPAYLCLLSFAMVRDKKWSLAALFLGIGAFTKWYPALLLPAYLVYHYRIEGRINWRMILVFAATCFIITLPTLLYGGIDALLVPYRFHIERGLETVSLPALISNSIDLITNGAIGQSYYIWAFLLLQVSTIPFVFFARIDKMEKLLNWCILIICIFVLFSRIYSPQWLLWILPFYILVSDSKIDTAIIIFYGITTYIAFPVTWDYYGGNSIQMLVLGIINIISLALVTLATIYRLRNSQSNPISQNGIA